MTYLLRFTTHILKSCRHPQCTLQLVCEDRVLFIWVDLHVSLCWQQHPYCERAIRLVYPPLFCTLRSSSNPTNKNLTELVWRLKELDLGNHSKIGTYLYKLCFLAMTDTITSKIIYLSFWITSYTSKDQYLVSSYMDPVYRHRYCDKAEGWT